MNKLQGRIRKIVTGGDITLVDIDTAGVQMTSIIVDRAEHVGYLRPAQEVEILFNESELSLGRIKEGLISLNNQLPCVIQAIVPGVVLSKVLLDFQGNTLVSLITSRSVLRLNLQSGDLVTAFVKSTEVLLKGLIRDTSAAEQGREAGCP